MYTWLFLTDAREIASYHPGDGTRLCSDGTLPTSNKTSITPSEKRIGRPSISTRSEFEGSRVWGDGTTSSSDGQFFRAGGRGEALGDVNARHGNEPGVAFYTHVSDQFGPFHTKVIAATASEAPHVLDGLLQHGTGLHIIEHYTDTGGATDQVFGLLALLGFRFAPRLRDLKDRKLFTFRGQAAVLIDRTTCTGRDAPLPGGSECPLLV